MHSANGTQANSFAFIYAASYCFSGFSDMPRC